MTRTPLLSAAYDDGMELVILLLLLLRQNGDGALRDLLDFWRENRDLIAAFMKNDAPHARADVPHPGKAQTPEKDQDRPPRDDPDLKILETFLRRGAP